MKDYIYIMGDNPDLVNPDPLPEEQILDEEESSGPVCVSAKVD